MVKDIKEKSDVDYVIITKKYFSEGSLMQRVFTIEQRMIECNGKNE